MAVSTNFTHVFTRVPTIFKRSGQVTEYTGVPVTPQKNQMNGRPKYSSLISSVSAKSPSVPISKGRETEPAHGSKHTVTTPNFQGNRKWTTVVTVCFDVISSVSGLSLSVVTVCFDLSLRHVYKRSGVGSL